MLNLFDAFFVTFIVALLGAVPVAPPGVQARPTINERLASVKTLKCTFPAMATGTWTKGAAEGALKPAKLSVGFDSIDTEDGTARVIGDFGPSEIIVRLANGTLHFLQSFRDGPLYVTTVFPKETRPGWLQAAHSRHEYTEVILPGFTSRPEQYYGECEVGS
jgi:hypothetical protein